MKHLTYLSFRKSKWYLEQTVVGDPSDRLKCTSITGRISFTLDEHSVDTLAEIHCDGEDSLLVTDFPKHSD